MIDNAEIAKEDASNYRKQFGRLFVKYWLIIFLPRAIFVCITGNLFLLLLLAPVAMVMSTLTPEFDIAVKFFAGSDSAWLFYMFTLLLVAVTSAILAALIASLAALDIQDLNWLIKTRD